MHYANELLKTALLFDIWECFKWVEAKILVSVLF